MHKVRKYCGDNGMSLVELIIAVAILGIVSVILLGFMNAGAKFYRNAAEELALKTESLIAMAQMSEYIIDCDSIDEWDSNHIIVTKDGLGTYSFTLSGGTIMLGDSTEEALLADGVEDFFVEFDGESKVTITLGLTKMGKTWKGEQVVYLRNLQ
jgi:prepilin-type N-terminal cleavage/methylation domain-containing protein